jgi:hypothetical protein
MIMMTIPRVGDGHQEIEATKRTMMTITKMVVTHCSKYLHGQWDEEQKDEEKEALSYLKKEETRSSFVFPSRSWTFSSEQRSTGEKRRDVR